MIYYNQRDYGNIPYPAPGYEDASVKTSGCGPVCMSMVIENLGAGTLPPEEAVKLALGSGARVSGGTDMDRLAKAICEKFPVKYTATTSLDAVLSAMRYHKAIVICNVKGNTGSYKGLFSDSGHYVVAAELGDVYVTVLDPYLYPGKFDTAARRGRAVLNGNLVYCTPENLAKDTKRYYIFERVAKEVDNMKDVTVKVGSLEIPAKLIGDVTYAPVRALIETIKKELEVTWTEKEGAGVKL